MQSAHPPRPLARIGLFAAVDLLLIVPGRTTAEDRRFLTTPGIVIKTKSNGEILHIIENPPTAQVTWAIAFSPKGDTVVYGTAVGELFA
jgi:hypothetical protein